MTRKPNAMDEALRAALAARRARDAEVLARVLPRRRPAEPDDGRERDASDDDREREP
jgi:hypothetical protein